MSYPCPGLAQPTRVAPRLRTGLVVLAFRALHLCAVAE